MVHTAYAMRAEHGLNVKWALCFFSKEHFEYSHYNRIIYLHFLAKSVVDENEAKL